MILFFHILDDDSLLSTYIFQPTTTGRNNEPIPLGPVHLSWPGSAGTHNPPFPTKRLKTMIIMKNENKTL